MSQNLDLPYNVVDIMTHLASPGGSHMAKAEAGANLRFPLWAVGHGLGVLAIFRKQAITHAPQEVSTAGAINA